MSNDAASHGGVPMLSRIRLSEPYLLLLLSLFLVSSIQPDAYSQDFETWTDASGKHKLVAEFVKLEEGMVQLRTQDGKMRRIPLSKLNLESRQLVKKHLEGANSDETTIPIPTSLADFNRQTRGSIKPQENSVVALWKAYGFEKLDDAFRADYLKALGLPANVKSNASFLTWKEFCSQQSGALGFEETTSPLDCTDTNAVGIWLRQNERSLNSVQKATLLKRYYSPLVNEPGDKEAIAAFNPSWVMVRDLARALSARSQEYLRNGQTDSAWESTLSCYRLSRLVSQEPTFMGSRIGQSIEAIACADIIDISISSQFGKNLATKCLGDFERLTPLPTTADKLLGQESIHLDSMRLVFEGGPAQFYTTIRLAGALLDRENSGKEMELERPNLPNSWPEGARKKWRDASILTGQYYQRWYDILSIDDPIRRNNQIESSTAKFEESIVGSRMFKIFDRNSNSADALAKQRGMLFKAQIPEEITPTDLAMFMNSLLFAEVLPLHRLEVTTRVRSGTIPVVLSLGAYRAEKGQYPETLQELVPEYLADAPVDIVHKTPLVYKRTNTGYYLYSLGPDGKDDHGNEDLDADRYDLAFTEVTTE